MDESEKPPWLRTSQPSKKLLELIKIPNQLLFQTSGRKLFLIILVVALGIGGIFYFRYQKEAQKGAGSLLAPGANTLKETADIIDRVGKLTELPNETPTVATISDVSKLASQPFFAKAQNGDKVLIYTNAKRAILYRPSTNKIIEIGPVNFPTPTQAKPTPNPTGEKEKSTPTVSSVPTGSAKSTIVPTSEETTPTP